PPRPERLGVVQAEELDIAEHEAGFLDDRSDIGERRTGAAREDVLLHPGIGLHRAEQADDRVEDEKPVRGQQLVAALEKASVRGPADVLEHADRDDPVISPGYLAVVLEQKPHLAGEPALGGALRRDGMLLGRERDARHLDAERLGEIERKTAIAAAD